MDNSDVIDNREPIYETSGWFTKPGVYIHNPVSEYMAIFRQQLRKSVQLNSTPPGPAQRGGATLERSPSYPVKRETG
jgi:hypothetical protein